MVFKGTVNATTCLLIHNFSFELLVNNDSFGLVVLVGAPGFILKETRDLLNDLSKGWQ